MGVVMTTIMWSLGVATLVPSVANAADATCPTLVAGDMIKVSGKPAIYTLDNNLKYRYFSDGDVFKSWNADDTYSAYYKTITQACFDSLMQPAAAPYHVFYRNGSEVVKYLSGDTLYAVGLNNVLYPITSAAATAIFGTSYKTRTIGLSEWPYYTKDTNTITEASVYPGMLAKVNGITYFVDTGKVLREVNAAGMTANRFRAADVCTLPTSAIAGLTVGTAITAEVATISSRLGTAAPVTPTVSGTLSVSLAADTPAAGNVVKDIDNVVFTKAIFSASANSVVSSVTVGRSGLGSTGDFASLSIYDGANKLGSTRTSWDSNNQITFNIPNGWAVYAGTPKVLTVVGNLDTPGTYNALGIVAVAANTASVAGLPVYGNQMSGVTVTVGGVTITNVGTGATKNIGTTDVTLANFKLAINSVENASFQRITLKNKAATNAADGDITNLSLYKGATKLAGPVTVSSDKITFVLSEPVIINKDKNEEFKVIGDVVAGSANQVEFLLDASTDLTVIGQTYNTNLTVTMSGYDTVSTDGMIIIIAGAQFNLAYSGVALETQADKTDITFGTLTMTAGGTDVKVTDLKLTLTEADGNSDATDNKDIDNFEMVESTGGAFSGTMTGGGDTDADAEVWDFADEIYLTKGQTRTFTLRGDIPTGVGTGDTYKVTMAVNTTNLVAETVPEGDAVSNFSIGSIDGKYITVKAPYITIRPVGQNSVNAVVNQTNVVLMKQTVEATAGPVTISRMRFEGGAAAASDVTYTVGNLDKTNFADYGLYVLKADGTYELLQLITNGNMTEGIADFNSFSYTVQPGSANKVTLVFKGTVSATLDVSNTTVHVQLDTITAKDADNNTTQVHDASGTDIETTAELETTGSITLGSTGILYVSMRNADTGFNKDRVALAGSSFWAGKLRLRAEYEAVKVMDLKLYNNSASDEDSVDSVCLYKSQSVASDQLIGCATMDSARYVFFDDINYVVAQGTQDVYIYTTLRPMSNLANGTADTGDLVEMSITTSSANNLTARGEASGTDLAYGNLATPASGEIVFDLNLDGTFDGTADETGTAKTKQFIVEGSKISNVAMVNTYGGNTVDSDINGTGQYTLGIFSITNEANGNTNASGDPLQLTIGSFSLDVTKHNTTTFSGATIQRINGSSSSQALVITDMDGIGEGATSAHWTLVAASSTLGEDAKISTGQTAYYVVKGTISGIDATTGVVDWVKVSLNNLGSATGGDNNIKWYDGYTISGATLVDYLQLDTTSIDGTKVSEKL